MNAPEPTPDSGQVVLVVDDNYPIRESLCRILTSAGIRSVGASSYQEAVNLQSVHLPAVAVIDHRLPDGSGTELARAIKERNPETVVIILTGFAAPGTTVDPDEQFYAYLIKPVRSTEFVQIVRDALAESPGARQTNSE